MLARHRENNLNLLNVLNGKMTRRLCREGRASDQSTFTPRRQAFTRMDPSRGIVRLRHWSQYKLQSVLEELRLALGNLVFHAAQAAGVLPAFSRSAATTTACAPSCPVRNLAHFEASPTPVAAHALPTAEQDASEPRAKTAATMYSLLNCFSPDRCMVLRHQTDGE